MPAGDAPERSLAERASCCSRVTFSYIWPVLLKAQQTGSVRVGDLGPPMKDQHCAPDVEAFQPVWEKEVEWSEEVLAPPSSMNAMFRTFRGTLRLCFVLNFLLGYCQVALPVTVAT